MGSERERNTKAEKREAEEERVKSAQKRCFGKKQFWFKLYRTVFFFLQDESLS